jgi:small subunit ribosomal protein S21
VDGDIEQALRVLKKKMNKEGILREARLQGHYEPPSAKRRRKASDALRRLRKKERKIRERVIGRAARRRRADPGPS